MPVSMRWEDDAHTLLHATFTDPWTWSQYLNNSNEMVKHLEAADHPLDIILDLSACKQVPPGMTMGIVEYAHQSGPMAHPRLGKMVVVLSGWLYDDWFGLFMGLIPGVQHKVLQTVTLEQAHILLNGHSPDEEADN